MKFSRAANGPASAARRPATTRDTDSDFVVAPGMRRHPAASKQRKLRRKECEDRNPAQTKPASDGSARIHSGQGQHPHGIDATTPHQPPMVQNAGPPRTTTPPRGSDSPLGGDQISSCKTVGRRQTRSLLPHEIRFIRTTVFAKK